MPLSSPPPPPPVLCPPSPPSPPKKQPASLALAPLLPNHSMTFIARRSADLTPPAPFSAVAVCLERYASPVVQVCVPGLSNCLCLWP